MLALCEEYLTVDEQLVALPFAGELRRLVYLSYHLLDSGLKAEYPVFLVEGVGLDIYCVLSGGFVLDIEHIISEIARLRSFLSDYGIDRLDCEHTCQQVERDTAEYVHQQEYRPKNGLCRIIDMTREKTEKRNYRSRYQKRPVSPVH